MPAPYSGLRLEQLLQVTGFWSLFSETASRRGRGCGGIP